MDNIERARQERRAAMMAAENLSDAQAAGTVTFECGTIPSSNLTVLVEVIT